MIYKEFVGFYYLTCDVCGEESGQLFDEFNDAVEWKKNRDNGWRSRMVDGEWQDECEECQGDAS